MGWFRTSFNRFDARHADYEEADRAFNSSLQPLLIQSIDIIYSKYATESLDCFKWILSRPSSNACRGVASYAITTAT